MESAEHYYAKKEYSTAIVYLKNQLKDSPEYDKARYLLGSAYLKVKKYKYAEKELSKAVQLKPDNSSYHVAYARSLLFNKKYKEVISLADTEINNAALEREILNILAAAYYADKQYAQAEKQGNLDLFFQIVCCTYQ